MIYHQRKMPSTWFKRVKMQITKLDFWFVESYLEGTIVKQICPSEERAATIFRFHWKKKYGTIHAG